MMIKKLLILFILLLLPGSQFHSTCFALEIKHPPSYEDLQKVGPNSSLEDFRVLQKALKFNPSELETIKKVGSLNQLIGAGIQTESDYQTGIDLLRIAVKKDPGNSIARAALVYHELNILYRHGSNAIDPRIIENSIAGLSAADPDNTLSIYLKAYLYVLLNKFDDASNEIIKADHKKYFETYEIEIRRCIIEAAEFLNYSPLVARAYSMMYLIGPVHFGFLVQEILNQENVKKEVAQSCFLLGKRLEDKAKWTIQLMLSYSIQGMALSRLKDQRAEKELNNLQQKDKRLRDNRMIYKNHDLSMISKSQHLTFYNDLYTYGEKKAVEKLYAVYNKNYILFILFQSNF